MTTSNRVRSSVVIAFATCLFLGMALTPPSGDDTASLLASLSNHSTQAYVTGLFRMLTSLLTVPALLAMAPFISGRGARLFGPAAALLHLASLAGVVIFTEMLLQNVVLAPMSDRRTAIAVASASESSIVWQISAIFYLLGMLVGFLLLGISLWRTGHGRLPATCVAAGLFLHIAGGDWAGTSITGALVLAAGFIGVGLRIASGNSGHRVRPKQDPLRALISDEPR